MSFFQAYVFLLLGVWVKSGPIDQNVRRHSKTASIGEESNFLLRQIGISDDVQVLTKNGTEGCQVNEEFYLEGADLPTQDPCEYCVCKPPGFACEVIKCEHKPECRALERAGLCCPEYVCDCEQDGVIYGNTDPVVSKDPCLNCFCVTGSITCSKITCQAPANAANCDVVQKENQCCPSYTNCVEEDLPLESVPTAVESVATVDSESPTTTISLTEVDETYNVITSEDTYVEQVEILAATMSPVVVEGTELPANVVTDDPAELEVHQDIGDLIIIDQDETHLNEIIPAVGAEELFVIEYGEEQGAESLGVDFADPFEIDIMYDDEEKVEVTTEVTDISEDTTENVPPQTDENNIIPEHTGEEGYSSDVEEDVVVGVEHEVPSYVLSSTDVEETEETTETAEFNAIKLPDEAGYFLESNMIAPPAEGIAITFPEVPTVSVGEIEEVKPVLASIDNGEVVEATESPMEDITLQPEGIIEIKTVFPDEDTAILKQTAILTYEDNQILTESDNSNLSPDDGEFWMSMLQDDDTDGKESLTVGHVRINDKLASVDNDASDISTSYESKKHIKESEIVGSDPKVEWNVNYGLNASPATNSDMAKELPPTTSEEKQSASDVKRGSEVEVTTFMEDVESVTEVTSESKLYEDEISVKSNTVIPNESELSNKLEVNEEPKSSLTTSSVQDNSVSKEESDEVAKSEEYPPTSVHENEILEKDMRNQILTEEESVVTARNENEEKITEVYPEIMVNTETEKESVDMARDANEEKITEVYPEMMVNTETEKESVDMARDANEEKITEVYPEMMVNTEMDEPFLGTESPLHMSDSVLSSKDKVVGDNEDMYWINMLNINATSQNNKLKEGKEKEVFITTLSPVEEQTIVSQLYQFRSDRHIITESGDIPETTLSDLRADDLVSPIDETTVSPDLYQFRSDLDITTQISEVSETTLPDLPENDIDGEAIMELREEETLTTENSNLEPTSQVENSDPTLKAVENQLPLGTDLEIETNNEPFVGVNVDKNNMAQQRESLPVEKTQVRSLVIESEALTETKVVAPMERLNEKRKKNSRRVTAFSMRNRPTRFETWKRPFVSATKNEYSIIGASMESQENAFDEDMEVLMNPLDMHFLTIARKYGLRPLTTRRKMNLKQRRKDFTPRKVSSFRKQRVF